METFHKSAKKSKKRNKKKNVSVIDYVNIIIRLLTIAD